MPFCESNCLLGENYVGESWRNVVLRWAEHEDPNKRSEAAKHLKYFPGHQFEWKVLTRPPEHMKKRKTLEDLSIKSISWIFNEQLYTELLAS